MAGHTFDPEAGFLYNPWVRPSLAIPNTLFYFYLLLFLLTMGLSSGLAQQNFFPANSTNDVSIEGVSAFEEQWYGESLRRMHEPSLLRLANETNAVSYRFLILPTWGNPIAVRIEREIDGYHLHARRLSGMGGYEAGTLAEQKDLLLTKRQAKRFEKLLSTTKFSKLATNDETRGFDGEQWILEGVTKGRYHLVVRWSATDDVKERRLTDFVRLCRFLIDSAKLAEPVTNKGFKVFH
jgi:hypothetical protein